MGYNTEERGFYGQAMKGCGALYNMIDQIGGNAEDAGDQNVAKILCDNEMALRALLTYALQSLSEDH